MRKLLSTVAVAGALCLSGAVQAQPTSYPHTIYGLVEVQKGNGPLLECILAVTFDYVSPPTPAEKKITNVQLLEGDDYCPSVQFPGGPWSFVYDPITHNFTIPNIFADTTVTPGDCEGSVTAVWNSTEYDINAILPAVDSGTGDCTIIGVLIP